ncbi:hypothetical protein N431DRAFT_489767 [Stipitochalara longipes BDJ]|nr:hypothetical protein N431DRAFT_489767 [Stipitochalara longipes BDJ]
MGDLAMMNNLPIASQTIDHSPNYWEDLVQCSYRASEEPPIGEFGRLQRLNLAHILNEIARIKASIRHSKTTSHSQMELLRRLLHEYSNAIRDYKYITQHQPLPAGLEVEQRIQLEQSFPDIANPFPVHDDNAPYDTKYLTLHVAHTQSADGVRELLRKVLPKQVSWTEKEKGEHRAEYSQGLPPQIYSTTLDRLARFIIGVAGGCSLIVPMVVMIFSPSLTKSVVTVSVAVVAFALAFSLVFETDNKDTVTATATYAAVLVVFVGTSLSNQ